MAGGRIKGITVEIGGDTTGLNKSLKGVNSTIKTTQSFLKGVNKLLKLDPANTNLITQNQKLLKDAVNATKSWRHLRQPRYRQGGIWKKAASVRTNMMPCRERSSKRKRSCSACSRKRKRLAASFPRSMKPERRWRELGIRSLEQARK